MTENYQKEIVQQIIRSLLHIQLLRIINDKPTWGYQIKKHVEAEFSIKLRHGALYPALNLLEQKGLVASSSQLVGRRLRKVYTLTENGKMYLQQYFLVLQSQLSSTNVGKDEQRQN